MYKTCGESEIEDKAKEAAFLMFLGGETFYFKHTKQGIEEVFKRQQFLGLLPRLAGKQQKSDAKSELFRASGNQAYKKRDFAEALRIYTRAVCCAEAEGKPIAMAYANRSAVHYELEAYNDSVSDVNHALNTGKYPDHLQHMLYERRGKCYMALSQYQKAAEDSKQVITLLLNSDLTQEKILYLKSHVELIAKCIGKVDVHQPRTAEPKLSYEPSSRIKSASAAIDVRYSTKMGRHVIATTNISPGDLLAVENPFVSVLIPDFYYIFCDNCKIRCPSSIPCTKCNNVVFCSENCRQESWDSHHSVECDLLPTLMNLGCGPVELIAVRALLKATKCGKDLERFVEEYLDGLKDSSLKSKRDKAKAPNKVESANVNLSGDYRSIHSLVTHEKDRSPDQLLMLMAMASSHVHVLRRVSNFFDCSDSFITSSGTFSRVSPLQLNHIVAADLIMKYAMVASCNAYVIEETNFTPGKNSLVHKAMVIGGAIYPFYSLINHSCDPDVALYSHNGDTLVLYAMKPIAKGQQIFVSYGIHYAQDDLFHRLIELKSNYFFTCECPACLNKWPLIDYVPDFPTFVSDRARKAQGPNIRDWFEKLSPIILAAEKGPVTQEQFQTLVHYLHLFHKFVKLPWSLHYLAQQAITRHFLFKGKHYINKGSMLDK